MQKLLGWVRPAIKPIHRKEQNMPRTRLLVLSCLALLSVQIFHAESRSFLSALSDTDTIVSTIPANGDINPYGVAVVPVTMGTLTADNVLVSNFNNAGNLQGTGKTIVQISPNGNQTLFTQIDANALGNSCPGGVGLTTALVALSSGFVIVGSLPTTDGTATTAQAGCLIILNSSGQVIGTLSGNGINGPWDMTALDNGSMATLFVTNVLNGTVAANGSVVQQGSVLRIVLSTPANGTPSVQSMTTIASAFGERTDPAALVIGPTGLGLASDGTLFVADTLGSRIAAITNAVSRTSDAGAGVTISQGRALKGPLGLAMAPNGDILTVNAGNGLIVETTPGGTQVGARFIDVSHSRNGAGNLFGLAVSRQGNSIYFVDDGNNTLNILQ
jgi:hypothetical protein